MHQHTLHTPFERSGKGLHTGLFITARFVPAAADTGIRLCRTDLAGCPCYEALASYVGDTTRGTVLQHEDWKISTVEHALSALYALGITNCLIEVDGPEMPILDGSAEPWVEAIIAAGIEQQAAPAKTWRPAHTIEYTAPNGSTYRIEPADQPQYAVEILFNGPILHHQTALLDQLADYQQQVANARTFCFVREIQPLLQRGYIKGGDLQNALVIYEQPIRQADMDALTDMLGQPRQDASALGYLQPLRYDNEPARHKLLDLIGDFSLLGVRLLARVTATRPGHSANTAAAKHLLQLIQQNN